MTTNEEPAEAARQAVNHLALLEALKRAALCHAPGPREAATALLRASAEILCDTLGSPQLVSAVIHQVTDDAMSVLATIERTPPGHA